MTRGIYAAGCISRPIGFQPANFVWISDTLLAHVFSRFNRQRRHGSCVPGPLEARRRASRRKNTSLAYPSWGDMFINSSDILGRAIRPGWWQNAVKRSADQHRDGRLSWLLEFLEPPARSRETPITLESIDGGGKLSITSDKKDRIQLLEHCQSLDDIYQLVQQHEIKLRHDPIFCDAILDHLLKQRHWVEEISALFTVPDFHPPGSSLHLKFVSMLPTLSLTNSTWDILRKSFCQAVTLGLISPTDLQEILHSVGRMKLQIPKPANERTANGVFLHGLISAMDRSSVLKLEDLGAMCLRSLLPVLAEHANFSSVLWLLAPWADLDHAHIFARVVLKRLSDMPHTHKLEDGSTWDFATLLAKLDQHLLLRVLPQVTIQLLGLNPDESKKFSSRKMTPQKIAKLVQKPKLLVNWRLTLLSLGTITGRFNEDDGVFTRVLNAPPEHRYPQIIATAWTCVSLCHNYPASRSLLHRLNFHEVYKAVSTSTSGRVTNDPLGRLVMEIYRLPLPNKKFLLQNLAPSIYARSNLVAFDPNLTTILEALVSRNYALLTDDEMFVGAWRNYPYELVDLAESMNPHLELFKMLSRKWIYNEFTSNKVIKRLLKHNHGLKIALSQVRPENSASSFYIAQLYNKTHQLNHEGMPTPEEALSFVNHIAASFATTPIYSPRARMNKLYWLYLYLHQQRAPITAEFTKALWYNCMDQHDGNGPATTLLCWVMEQVSKAEGPEVATRLELYPSYRANRRKEFENSIIERQEHHHADFDELNRIDDKYWDASSKKRFGPTALNNWGERNIVTDDVMIRIVRSGSLNDLEEAFGEDI